MNHVVKLRNLTFRVCDDRIANSAGLRFIDIADPSFVAFYIVYTDRDDLYIALIKFRFQAGHAAQLRGAYRGIIFWMGEQDASSVSEPFMEFNRALSGLGGEVRCRVA